MIERPKPPAGHKKAKDDASVEALRVEVRRMKDDVAFLKGLLEHLRGEFARLKR